MIVTSTATPNSTEEPVERSYTLSFFYDMNCDTTDLDSLEQNVTEVVLGFGIHSSNLLGTRAYCGSVVVEVRLRRPEDWALLRHHVESGNMVVQIGDAIRVGRLVLIGSTSVSSTAGITVSEDAVDLAVDSVAGNDTSDTDSAPWFWPVIAVVSASIVGLIALVVVVRRSDSNKWSLPLSDFRAGSQSFRTPNHDVETGAKMEGAKVDALVKQLRGPDFAFSPAGSVTKMKLPPPHTARALYAANRQDSLMWEYNWDKLFQDMDNETAGRVEGISPHGSFVESNPETLAATRRVSRSIAQDVNLS